MRQRRKPTGYKKFEDFNAFSASEEGWRSKANCLGKQTENFFAASKSPEARRAILICNSCSVSAECLLNALSYQYHGIWGGFTEEERSKIVSLYLDNNLSDLTLEKIKSIKNQLTPVEIKTIRSKDKNNISS